MNTKAVEIMAKSFDPVEVQECSGYCAATGIEITEGKPKGKTIKSLNDVLNVLSYPNSKWISEPVARVFANDWNMGSRIFFENGENWHPLVNPENAASQGRPAWRDIVKELANYEGNLVIIFNTEFKKKCWPMALPTKIGNKTKVLLNNPKGNISRILTVDWQVVNILLELVHDIRLNGFHPVHQLMAAYFNTSLLEYYAGVSKVGIAKTKEYDNLIKPYRNSDELLFVTHIEGYKL